MDESMLTQFTLSSFRQFKTSCLGKGVVQLQCEFSHFSKPDQAKLLQIHPEAKLVPTVLCGGLSPQ